MSLLIRIKRFLYFPFAYYFRFFAQIQLAIWQPKIIVVTGSNAKTTLLHLIESQVGEKARYSQHANSSFGIPFDILGLKREKLTADEWPALFLLAPLKAFKKPFSENLYIVEADCDRPYEGKFLSTLLKPEVTIWISIAKTHSMNFPAPVEENIAFEFGYFLENSKSLVVINVDSPLIKKQLSRTKAKVIQIGKKGHLQKYTIGKNSTEFKIDNKTYKFNFLLPEEAFYQIMSTLKLADYLHIPFDKTFANFKLPPSRSSAFTGIKNTTLIDSSYNANLSSMTVMLNMFDKIPSLNKWVVLGDMLEQGSEEQSEHQKLAEEIAKYNFKKVILMGPRVAKYTYPLVKSAVRFETPREVLDYLKENIQGGETILFKGARFLEGVIEHLLKNKEDVKKLCRREEIWQIRRRQWGL